MSAQRDPVLPRPPWPAPALGVALLIAAIPGVQALGLGPALQQSALGQPLRVVVPVLLGDGDDLPGECVRLEVPAAVDPDGVPRVTAARLALLRTGEATELVVTTPRAVTEPVLRMTLRVGCENPVKREYTLLLDPLPAIETPVAADNRGGVAPASAPAADEAPSRRAGAEAGASPRATGKGRSVGPTASRGSSSPASANQRGSPPKVATRAPMAKARPPATNGRLRISGNTPGRTAAPGRADNSPEAMLALEAETLVLQRRVAELAVMMERMDEEIRATAARLEGRQPIPAPVLAPSAPPIPASAPAPAPRPVAERAWWERTEVAIGGGVLLGVALLALGGLLRSRWRQREREAGVEASIMAAAPARPRSDSPAAVPLPPAGAGTLRQPPAPPGRAEILAVSELSHVTDEAHVYLTLGRPERAIEVLRRHITEQRASLPAAWIMLLELYRGENREQDFRLLAEDFHRRFNAQAPQWETFAAGQDDGSGLAAFPHIVDTLTANWGTETCRSYLERLLYDNRQGRRAGFSLAVYDEILTLHQVLEARLLADSDSTEEEKLRDAWAAARRSIDMPARPAAPPTAAAVDALSATMDLELDLDEAIRRRA